MAGAATAGAAYHTSADAAAVATAGKGKRTDATALANASAGSSEDSSTVTIATASHGEGKDTDDISVAKKGSGSGSGEPGDGGKQGEHDADPAAATGGLEIPGKSDAETAKAVADAARIDAQLQKASQAQKDLLIYLAQQSGELEYEVPDSNWLVTFVTATKGLSEADIKFLQQQQWKPGNVSAEELRKQIDERLKNRNMPQGGEKKGAEAKQHDAPDAKDKKGADDKGAAAEVKKPDDTLKAASLDETAIPSMWRAIRRPTSDCSTVRSTTTGRTWAPPEFCSSEKKASSSRRTESAARCISPPSSRETNPGHRRRRRTSHEGKGRKHPRDSVRVDSRHH